MANYEENENFEYEIVAGIIEEKGNKLGHGEQHGSATIVDASCEKEKPDFAMPNLDIKCGTFNTEIKNGKVIRKLNDGREVIVDERIIEAKRQQKATMER